MNVRLAVSADRAALCAMLARAFADDPAMVWLFPDAALRAQRLPRLFALLFDHDGPAGTRLTVGDAAAATFWRGPGMAASSFADLLRAAGALLAIFGRATPRALAISHAIEAHFPREPFWYLHVAGCDPAQQGKGLGAMAVRAGIERMGGAGLPFYLETATERNLGFYQAQGFRVTEEWRVGTGGPRFWSMRRG